MIKKLKNKDNNKNINDIYIFDYNININKRKKNLIIEDCLNEFNNIILLFN